MCGVVLGDRLRFPTKVAPRKVEPTTEEKFRLWRLNGEIPGTPPINGGRSKRRLDRRGSIGTIWVSTKLGFGKILRGSSLWSRQIYGHIHKTKQKWNEFSFNLIYVINQAKNGFVCLRVILKNPRRPNNVLTLSKLIGSWEYFLRVLAQHPKITSDAPSQPKRINQGKGRGSGACLHSHL